jgi:hypothetical protein
VTLAEIILEETSTEDIIEKSENVIANIQPYI